MAREEEYITASALAEKHGVTMSTVRRRIKEGELFKGAKKEKMSFGEVWKIPRSEAEAISLKELSPKLYQSRHKDSIKTDDSKEEGEPSLKLAVGSLEERVGAIEQYLFRRDLV